MQNAPEVLEVPKNDAAPKVATKPKGALPSRRSLAIFAGIAAVAGLYFYPLGIFVAAKAAVSKFLTSFVAANYLELVTSLTAYAGAFTAAAGAMTVLGKVTRGLASLFSGCSKKAACKNVPQKETVAANTADDIPAKKEIAEEPIVCSSPAGLHQRKPKVPKIELPTTLENPEPIAAII